MNCQNCGYKYCPFHSTDREIPAYLCEDFEQAGKETESCEIEEEVEMDNPNRGKCGMLNSRGFCSLTACRYPSNAIVVESKVIRGMMVNPQIEKTQTNADRIRQMSDEELAELLETVNACACSFVMGKAPCVWSGYTDRCPCWIDWLKQEVDNG